MHFNKFKLVSSPSTFCFVSFYRVPLPFPMLPFLSNAPFPFCIYAILSSYIYYPAILETFKCYLIIS